MGAMVCLFSKNLLCPIENQQSDGASNGDCQMCLFVFVTLSLLMDVTGEAREISNPPYQSATNECKVWPFKGQCEVVKLHR
jgi:hypothetical protein